MAFFTYLLIGGVSLGIQERFSPEVLGIQASTALIWALLEVFAIWVTLYVMNIQTKLSSFDILAFSSYKYVGYKKKILSAYAYNKLVFNKHFLFYFMIQNGYCRHS